MVLTDACAILPSLKTLPANPAEEAKDLEKLAAWCQRYTPWTAPRLPDAQVGNDARARACNFG
jgi:protein ImuB